MIILATTSDVIRLVTTAAVALDVHCSWVDNQTATATPYTPGRTNTAISTATTTTVLPSPAASTQRQLKKMTANARGGANTVTVEYFDGTTAFRVLSVALATGETIEYEDATGWAIHDASGALKTTGVGLGRFTGFQILTSGTVYTPTAGTTSQIVEGIAGGGGGGGSAIGTAANAGMGGGGGSGGYFRRRYAISGAATGTYAIGAAGTAGANTGAVAGNGGNTTFTDGTTLCTANGGAGAPAQVAVAAAAAISLGGAGGAISTNGQVNEGGNPGGMAFRMNGLTGIAGGQGGESYFGGAGAPRVTQGAGANAIANSGSGGGGAAAIGAVAAVVGGTGAAGIIIVWEFA